MIRAIAILVLAMMIFHPGAPAFAEMLYAGVTHTDSMDHVNEVRKRINIAPPQKPPVVKNVELAKPKEVVATTAKSHPLTAAISQSVSHPFTQPSPPPPAKTLYAQAAAAPPPTFAQEVAEMQKTALSPQKYLPEFGVAHVAANREPIAPNGQKLTVQWFMIPHFMAGVWEKDGDLTTSVTNVRTGRHTYPNIWVNNKLRASWGHQKDAKGNIWHVNLLPAERDGYSDGKLVHFLTVAQQCEVTNQSQLVTRSHYLIHENDARSGAAEGTFQQESLNDYVHDPETQGLSNTSSNRVFDYQGAPFREGQLLSKFRKIGDFSPTGTLMGMDLRESLKEYLLSQGYSSLVSK